MDKKTLRKADLVMSLVLILFSVFVFSESMKLMQRTLNLANPDYAIWYRSAGLIPMIVSVLLAVSALSLFVTAWRSGARFDFLKKEKIEHFFTWRESKIAGFVIGWLAFYIFILLGPVETLLYNGLYAIPGIYWMIPEYVPYILMTFIYLFVFIMAFSDREVKKDWTKAIIISAVVAIAVAYLFGQVAMVVLP